MRDTRDDTHPACIRRYTPLALSARMPESRTRQWLGASEYVHIVIGGPPVHRRHWRLGCLVLGGGLALLSLGACSLSRAGASATPTSTVAPARPTTIAGFPAVIADTQGSGPVNGGAMLRREFVANGLFYIIQLMSPHSLAQVQQRLGPLYASVLASFQPGPGEPSNAICPAS